MTFGGFFGVHRMFIPFCLRRLCLFFVLFGNLADLIFRHLQTMAALMSFFGAHIYRREILVITVSYTVSDAEQVKTAWQWGQSGGGIGGWWFTL